MMYFLCVKNNSYCRKGQYLANENEGEDFFLVNLEQTEGRNRWKATVRSKLQLPFSALADCVVPLGFKVPIRLIHNTPGLPTEAATAKEIEDFKTSTDDIYEPEKLARDKAANPTHTGRKK